MSALEHREEIEHLAGRGTIRAGIQLTGGATNGTITFPVVAPGYRWLIENGVVVPDAVNAGLIAYGYVNGTNPDQVVANSYHAPGDVAVWLQSSFTSENVAVVGEGEVFIIKVSLAAANQRLDCSLFVRVVQIERRVWVNRQPPQIPTWNGEPGYGNEPWPAMADDYPDAAVLDDRAGGSSQDSDGPPADPGRGRPVEPDTDLPPPDATPVPVRRDVF